MTHRRSACSTAALADADADTAAAAIEALGRIGGSQAAEALLAAEPRLPAASASADWPGPCCVVPKACAAGHADRPRHCFEKLSAADRPRAVRIAAILGVAAAPGGRSGDVILAALTGQGLRHAGRGDPCPAASRRATPCWPSGARFYYARPAVAGPSC